ncbi:hypothetical protein B0181_11475 [Moraxella caviae]|uniref:DNA methylase adenine-specific domain-containing protein n=1 Tax=Moraxella caviae TaxID=34060 RepID=A0A1S9ZTF3_9GAMM|nr:hypothetical protein [Moraxella caviae]OOR86784.1 hypothetical protein B0181_11475 [Moraxella caviae]
MKELVKAKDDTMTGKNAKDRAKKFAEVTTSIDLIDQQILLLPKAVILDLSKTVLDPCTGDGRYLMRYLYHRLPSIKTADDLAQAVSTLYGVELQQENVTRARNNMLALSRAIAGHLGFKAPKLQKIINNNIRQGDFLHEPTF